MPVPLLILLALGALASPQASQTSGEDLPLGLLDDVSALGFAFVEIDTARDTYLLREPFTLTLRFGLEAEFLRANAVQLFQRELDVPVQVHAPWLETLDGAEAAGELEPAAGPTLALGERVLACAAADARVVDGKTFAVFELSRRFAAVRTGALELASPLLRVAYATRFEDDFTSGRRAADRHDGVVRGTPKRLTILALPEEGRPAQFSGAIGSFTLAAEAEPRELELGQSLGLSLILSGSGDLSQCEPPHLDDLADFHVRGRLVERVEDKLIARYDLAPEHAGVRAIPAIELVTFDPTPPAAYRTLASPAIPITVRAAPAAPPAAAPQPESGSERNPWLLAGALLVLLMLLGAWKQRRARRVL